MIRRKLHGKLIEDEIRTKQDIQDWDVIEMERLHQLYLNNITLARNLTKPPIHAEMSKDAVIQTIHNCAEKLNQIHQENDKILKVNLSTESRQKK